MSSFQVYKYEHPEFGPIMLLLDDQEPEHEEPKKKNEEFLDNKRRGSSFRPPLPAEKKSIERPYQKSLERKKSIENGITLPNIANKKKQFKR